MDRFHVRHTSGWVACMTHSRARAQSWINEFNPDFYTEKGLRAEDFIIVDTQATSARVAA